MNEKNNIPVNDNLDNDYFINKITEITTRRQDALHRPLYATVRTFGCQMNAHDSEKLETMLLRMGYELSNDETADVILYNTCCVRENAENRIYGHLGYMKNLKTKTPDIKVIVCGCMAQQSNIAEQIKKHYGFVDLLFGTFNINRFPSLFYSHLTTGKQIIDISENNTENDSLVKIRRHFAKKADINIM
ncbi:MAG: tRNA (N6-isopentenyl adenosine(37)-C2)-methylthiotransferase MiaB, partial [Clostridiales bacterium]|nr:tRNA (N6-isopentenyl adenosine(37)-C2)-methylthiotransferase MiaB [Clostridiales bacterium]